MPYFAPRIAGHGVDPRHNVCTSISFRDDKPMIGEKIQHYETMHELGRGGMGTVYEAEDARLGRRVAIKVLPVEATRDRDQVQRFKREAKTASALNHPGIVTMDGLWLYRVSWADLQK